MPRNLDRRIELMFPVLDRSVFKEVKNILEIYFEDRVNALELTECGQWKEISTKKDDLKKRAQEMLYKKYKRRNETAAKKPKIGFEVRRKD